jgi:preprotein translocase subunit SecE
LDLNPGSWWEKTTQYVVDVRAEFRKITWPTQREYVSGTIGVLVIVAFLTLVIGLFDVGLARIMKLFLG